MLVLDTCALVFDALQPGKLSRRSCQAIERAEQSGQLACCDISLWEIAMLIAKERLDLGIDCTAFLELLLAGRTIQVLNSTPEIATLSAQGGMFSHHDPADRIIAATTILYHGQLVTCDKKLTGISGLAIIW